MQISIVVCGCGFADLRVIGVSHWPQSAGTVLENHFSPVWVSFDTAMDENESGGVLQVRSARGNVEGDTRWDGSRLVFTPVEGWDAGSRYTLSLEGGVLARDGRELELDTHVPFFAVTKNAASFVERFTPADGAFTGVTGDDGARVEIRFSLPMDRKSAEEAFTASAFGEKQFVWSEDDTVLSVESEKPLAPWTEFRWEIGEKALSRDGVPLAAAVQARFTTAADTVRPRVLDVYPVIRAGGAWAAAGTLEDDWGAGLGLAVEFSKPMGDGFLSSLSFEPAIAGRTERLSASALVFIPEEDPVPEICYTCIISAEAADVAGLSMEKEYRRIFTADIPFLRLVSLETKDGLSVIDSSGGKTGGTFDLPVDTALDGLGRVSLKFSYPFSQNAKTETPFRVSLSAYFPADVSTPSMKTARWDADDTLVLEWEDLVPGTEDEGHWYKLTIPGGRAGTANGEGFYLRENIEIILEALKAQEASE